MDQSNAIIKAIINYYNYYIVYHVLCYSLWAVNNILIIVLRWMITQITVRISDHLPCTACPEHITSQVTSVLGVRILEKVVDRTDARKERTQSVPDFLRISRKLQTKVGINGLWTLIAGSDHIINYLINCYMLGFFFKLLNLEI